MNTISSRFDTVARVLPSVRETSSEAFGARLTELYTRSQKSNYVFASPLGPVYHHGRHLHVPRFVYFGPHTHDESLRLAFLAGFESSDLRVSNALVEFVERLIGAPDLGQGLNLSFFPLVDVLGLSRGEKHRELASANWGYSSSPEIDVLEKDARARGYHGFIRLESSSSDSAISVRLRDDSDGMATGIELVSSVDFEPWGVRWEADPINSRVGDGPLTVVDDLPIRPFELTIRFPSAWSSPEHERAIDSILRALIARQRALQAYGQHL